MIRCFYHKAESVSFFVELPGNKWLDTFQSPVMCPSGCIRFLPFSLLSLTCFAVVHPAPCEFRDSSIKQLFTALSQYSQLAERTNCHLATDCPCTWSWSVTDLAQQNLIMCVSFCDRYQLIISACFLGPFLYWRMEQTCETCSVACKDRYFSGCFLATCASVLLIKCH
jgi:hypothetical protein